MLTPPTAHMQDLAFAANNYTVVVNFAPPQLADIADSLPTQVTKTAYVTAVEDDTVEDYTVVDTGPGDADFLLTLLTA